VSGDYIKKSVPDTSRGTSTSPLLLISNLGAGDGINGRAKSGIGVSGRSDSNDGVVGWTGGSDNSGVFGSSTDGRGVVGRSDNDDGVVGWTGAAEKSGVFGHSTNGNGVTGQSENLNGVYGTTTINNQSYAGVSGYSQDGIAVLGKSKNNNGVVGWTGVSQSGAYCGVYGYSTNGTGVRGWSENYIALQGTNKSDTYATLSVGNEGGAAAIYAQAGTGKIAAVFRGNVQIQSLTTQAPIIELGEGLDYAESFDLTNNAEIIPGTVLIIDPDNPGKLAISTKPYDHKVAGIVAGAKGLGSGVRLGCAQFDNNVALAGRVYCNVDASYGEVSPGDLLTTSPTPGYAMVVKNNQKAQGAILGKAMERLAAGQKGQILVLVTLQ